MLENQALTIILKHENTNDKVIWNHVGFRLVDIGPSSLASIIVPADYGMTAKPICKYCQRGYYCTFHLVGDQLLLTNLNIMAEEEHCPLIGGVAPVFCSDDHSMEYRRLRHPVSFSGTIRIGNGPTDGRYEWRQLIGPKTIRQLWDLDFVDGKLVAAEDKLPEVAKQKEAAKLIREYVARNLLPKETKEKLLSYCRYSDDFGDRHSVDVPYFDVLKPAEAFSALKRAIAGRNTPEQFIKNYAESGLSRQLTMHYLKHLGMSEELIEFLKGLVTETQTEKMIVLEVIETMLRGIAASYWDDRVQLGSLYHNANIPKLLTNSIRKRLSGITMASWLPEGCGCNSARGHLNDYRENRT